MLILRTNGFVSLPWKNGLGVSSVIASDPPGAGYDKVSWQVGTTAITAHCPFSSLPGMDRQFTVLEGAGVELTCVEPAAGVNIRKAVDAPHVPFAFRGDSVTTCRLLGGPVKVLNVMTRRGRAAANLGIRRFAGPLLVVQRPGETVLAVLLSGTAAVPGGGVPLAPNDTVRLEAASGDRCEIFAPQSGARIAIVRLSSV